MRDVRSFHKTEWINIITWLCVLLPSGVCDCTRGVTFTEYELCTCTYVHIERDSRTCARAYHMYLFRTMLSTVSTIFRVFCNLFNIKNANITKNNTVSRIIPKKMIAFRRWEDQQQGYDSCSSSALHYHIPLSPSRLLQHNGRAEWSSSWIKPRI